MVEQQRKIEKLFKPVTVKMPKENIDFEKLIPKEKKTTRSFSAVTRMARSSSVTSLN